MLFPLTNAAGPADPMAIIIFVFECLLLMGGVLLVALGPIFLALRRDRRRVAAVRGIVIVWSILVWGTCIYALWQHDQWTQTYYQRLMSGYYDATDPYTTADKPHPPWIAWGAEAAGYAIILAWSALPPERQG